MQGEDRRTPLSEHLRYAIDAHRDFPLRVDPDVWQGLEAHSPITLGSPCDASDWFSSDGSKMPRRSTRGSSPTWEACWAESLSEAAMGSLVKVRRVQALAIDEPAHHARVLTKVLGPYHEQCGREQAIGPEVALVQEHLAAPFENESRRPRLRHPGAVDLTGSKGLQRLGVVLRVDGDVTTAFERGLQAVA